MKKMANTEDPSTTCMWFKMRLADKTVMIATWFKQWNQLADVANNYTEGMDGQVERITIIKSKLKMLRQFLSI